MTSLLPYEVCILLEVLLAHGGVVGQPQRHLGLLGLLGLLGHLGLLGLLGHLGLPHHHVHLALF